MFPAGYYVQGNMLMGIYAIVLLSFSAIVLDPLSSLTIKAAPSFSDS